jgi:hypothetical protein
VPGQKEEKKRKGEKKKKTKEGKERKRKAEAEGRRETDGERKSAAIDPAEGQLGQLGISGGTRGDGMAGWRRGREGGIESRIVGRAGWTMDEDTRG